MNKTDNDPIITRMEGIRKRLYKNDLRWLPHHEGDMKVGRGNAHADMCYLMEEIRKLKSEYICTCGLRVIPHVCEDSKGDF